MPVPACQERLNDRLLHITNHFTLEPEREEFVEVTEVAPVLLTKPRRNRKMTGGQRARLIAQWARRLYDMTASWQGPIGMQLAYLFAAMARGSHVALNRQSALVRLLRQEAVPASDPIWRVHPD